MNETRLANHVRVRMDGGGDTWAGQHRHKLPACWYLSDADQTHRQILEIENRENRTFAVSVLDDYSNRGKIVRRVATLCRIDRKKTADVARRELETGKAALVALLNDCRNDRAMQGGLGGRCFLVCGTGYPFVYIEIDPFSGQEIQEVTFEKDSDWHELYDSLGLVSERLQLERWLATGDATDGR